MFKIILVLAVSLMLIACSNKTKHTEIDYQAINCAGWKRGSISRQDQLTSGTKEWILSHIIKYDRDCKRPSGIDKEAANGR